MFLNMSYSAISCLLDVVSNAFTKVKKKLTGFNKLAIKKGQPTDLSGYPLYFMK